MAIGFVQAGADVLVNYSSDEPGARETAKAIEALGKKAVVFKANQSRESEVKAMFECMFKTFGQARHLRSQCGHSTQRKSR